ncbi:MAG TPA: hypothetical protein VLV87_07885 [Gammaproteobacteria bacterium]|nr:hypothetical protein [Gammaproteobacteria bacterium]
MPAIHGQHRENHLPQRETAVCCRLCDPPQQVEVPARVFYRLKDVDSITCSNGHRGTLLEYKQAAADRGTAYGPFVRYG